MTRHDLLRILSRIQSQIATPGIVIVAPDSRGLTWDVVRDGLGPDVRFLDDALRAVFDRYPIDRGRVCAR
jgi:phospholipase/carboxylesterase